MYCEKCGTRVPDGVSFCPNCGEEIQSEAEVYNYVRPVNNDDARPRPQKRRDKLGGLALAEGETLVKQYHCSRILFPRSEGYLSVTTKRLIFHASSQGILVSRISKEVPIDKVTGVDCYYGTNFFLKRFITGILVFILGIIILGADYPRYLGGTGALRFLGFLIFLAGIAITFTCFTKSFKVSVYAAECNVSPITVGQGAITALGNSVLYAIDSAPTEDTDKMMNELGALIHDMQTMGEVAVSKWKQ